MLHEEESATDEEEEQNVITSAGLGRRLTTV